MEEISRERLKKIVGKIVGLPTLPAILEKMNTMTADPDTSAQQIGDLISKDPTITAKVLRIVNSSFYGFPNRISTVSHAIVILGFNAVKSIVLSSSIFEAMGKAKRESSYDRGQFWKHSIGVGTSCRVIARKLRLPSEEEYFIGGLLHDIGKIILDQYLHDQFEEILKVVQKKKNLIRDAELEVLGVTHAEIGGWLFNRWGLSKDLVDAVNFHHRPGLAQVNRRFCAIIHLGDILTRALGVGSGGDGRIPLIDHEAWRELGFELNVIDAMLPEIEDELAKAMVFLDFIR